MSVIEKRDQLIITNGTLVSLNKVTIQDIKISNDKIVEVGQISDNTNVLDASGCYVIPGLIDVHIHGIRGKAVTDEDINSLKFISRALLEQGITGFTPTGSAIQEESNLNLLKNSNKLSKTDHVGSEVLGVHMEGPFLNVEKRGAQPEKFIMPLTKQQVDKFIKAGDGIINRFTLASEIENGLDTIKYLKENNILVAAGHTNATYDQMIEGIDAGISIMNHFFNGMRGFHHREPGAVGAGFLDDRVVCEVICDGVHVHPKAVELAVRVKGFERICMISDNTITSGLPDGEYELPGKTVKVTSKGNFDNFGSLTGSQKTLMDGFKFMVKEMGYPIEKVVQMASYNPAKLLNVSHKKGSISVGKDADIVILTKNLEVKHVIKGQYLLSF